MNSGRLRDFFEQPISESLGPTKEKESLGNIHDILNCFICFDKVKNPSMCPHCSKMCCRDCIKKWLIGQKLSCPHCRNPLRVSQLVTVRFIQDLTAAIQGIKKKTQQEEKEECDQHAGTQLNYFCETCNKAICSDCAMFESTHKHHSFTKITKVYDEHVQKLKSELQVLSSQLQGLQNTEQQLQTQATGAQLSKQEKLQEIELHCENMKQRLENFYEVKGDEINALSRRIALHIHDLQSQVDRYSEIITDAPKSQLISQSASLQAQMSSAIQTNAKTHCELKLPSQTPYQSELVPDYSYLCYNLPHFYQYMKSPECEDIVYSPALRANGLAWRLKIYPNGNGVARGKSISVFLEMQRGLPEAAKYDYKIVLEAHGHPGEPRLSITRQFQSTFQVGECWGYNKFVAIDKLEQGGYLSPEHDFLIFHLYVRAPTYAQHSKDQARYITLLHSKLGSAEEEVLFPLEEENKTEENKEESAPTSVIQSPTEQEDEEEEEERGEEVAPPTEEQDEQEDEEVKQKCVSSPRASYRQSASLAGTSLLFNDSTKLLANLTKNNMLLRSHSDKDESSPPPLPPRLELDMNPIVHIRKDSEEEDEDEVKEAHDSSDSLSSETSDVGPETTQNDTIRGLLAYSQNFQQASFSESDSEEEPIHSKEDWMPYHSAFSEEEQHEEEKEIWEQEKAKEFLKQLKKQEIAPPVVSLEQPKKKVLKLSSVTPFNKMKQIPPSVQERTKVFKQTELEVESLQLKQLMKEYQEIKQKSAQEQ